MFGVAYITIIWGTSRAASVDERERERFRQLVVDFCRQLIFQRWVLQVLERKVITKAGWWGRKVR